MHHVKNRRFALAELAGYFGLYIYCFWFATKSSFAAASATTLFFYPFFSNFIQKKSWREMGFESSAFFPGLKNAMFILIPAIVALIYVTHIRPFRSIFPSYDLIFGSVRIRATPALLFSIYPIFAFIQQFILISFIFERIFGLCRREEVAAVLSTLVFTAAHFPNPLMMMLSFIGTAVFFVLFLKQRNIIPIVLLHAVLGLLTFYTCIGVTRTFAVGKAYFHR